jgi:hypothetical protein
VCHAPANEITTHGTQAMHLNVYGAVAGGGLSGGPGEAFARSALACAPTSPDEPMLVARTALAGASILRDVPMLADADARAGPGAGLRGGPGEAFARMAMAAVSNSANSLGRRQAVPSAERLPMFTVGDTLLGQKRARGLLPMPRGCSPPRLDLCAANPRNSKAQRTNARVFSKDCIIIQ